MDDTGSVGGKAAGRLLGSSFPSAVCQAVSRMVGQVGVLVAQRILDQLCGDLDLGMGHAELR